jgi:Recombination endonuclease VII
MSDSGVNIMWKTTWEKHEEDLLLSLKENKLAHSAIAEILGKSLSAVNHKLQRLGRAKKQFGTRLIDGFKICSKCLIKKDAKAFANNKSRIDGKDSYCNSCKTEIRYNMEMGEYSKLCQKQNNKCAICREPCDFLNVDHCHKKGSVRELLCGRCNSLLGLAQDNPKILKNAILYLDKHL